MNMNEDTLLGLLGAWRIPTKKYFKKGSASGKYVVMLSLDPCNTKQVGISIVYKKVYSFFKDEFIFIGFDILFDGNITHSFKVNDVKGVNEYKSGFALEDPIELGDSDDSCFEYIMEIIKNCEQLEVE